MALHASAIRVDITPELYLPNAGFSLQGTSAAWEVRHRLFATIVRLEDGPSRAFFVTLDLHAATRLIVQRLAAHSGVPEAELFVVGTHTHSAPGNVYGYPYFDMFASKGIGRNAELVEWLAGRLAAAIAALPASVPAKVAYAKRPATDLVRNRAIASFALNHAPGGGALTPKAFATQVGNPSPSADPEHLAVDPNVHLLWIEDLAGVPLAALASFGAHNTVSGCAHRAVSADAFGVAVRQARDRLRAVTGPDFPLGLMGGSSGDAEFVGERPVPKDNWAAVEAQGVVLGNVLAEGCLAARGTGTPGALTLRYREDAAIDAPVRPPFVNAAVTLAPEGWVGSLVKDGAYGTKPAPKPVVAPTHPQWPKVQFFVQALLGAAVPLPQHFVFRIVDVAGVRLVGLPGEPTNTLVARVRTAVPGARGTIVCGYAGDYVGYLTTPEEYEHQRYEGMSTLWGRWTGAWILQQLTALANGAVTPVGVPNVNLHPAAMPRERTQVPAAHPGATTLMATRKADGWLLQGTWWVRPGCTALPPMSGPAAQLDFPPTVVVHRRPNGGAWAVLPYAGEPVNDQTRSILVWVNRTVGSWQWEWRLPLAAAAAGDKLRFEVGHPGLLPTDPRSNEVVLG